ncbi:MAG: hypothetical protein ACI9YE_002544 [Psychroserpens sp.]|jgi:hypothetical protein
MNWTTFISSIIASGLLAGLVAALVTLRVSERKIVIENVTQERTKWREKIRRITLDIHKAFLTKETEELELLHTELTTSLNPEDTEDQDILACLKHLITNGSGDRIGEFKHRIALLLKHDWQRAKWESEKAWWRSAQEPKRVRFSDSKYS